MSLHPQIAGVPSHRCLTRTWCIAWRAEIGGAFEVLYRRYYRRLFGFLARWIEQPDVIEEVLDDVMFTVWTDAAKFEGRSRPSTWIFGIAHHQAHARLRRRREETSLDEAPEPFANDPEPERWELRTSLAEALATLSSDQRASWN